MQIFPLGRDLQYCSNRENTRNSKKKNAVESVISEKIWTSHFFHKIISTHLLLVAIGFCLVLLNAAEPYFQGFCGIDVFIWERLNSSICAEMVQKLV